MKHGRRQVFYIARPTQSALPKDASPGDILLVLFSPLFSFPAYHISWRLLFQGNLTVYKKIIPDKTRKLEGTPFSFVVPPVPTPPPAKQKEIG